MPELREACGSFDVVLLLNNLAECTRGDEPATQSIVACETPHRLCYIKTSITFETSRSIRIARRYGFLRHGGSLYSELSGYFDVVGLNGQDE